MNIKTVPDINNCVEVGKIVRPHGKDGEVLVALTNIDASDFQENDFVFFCLQERLVPFYMESVSLKSNSVFVRFEDIKTMEKAELYSSTKLYLESAGDDETDDYDSEFIGYSVVDYKTNEKIGEIQEVIAYSMNVVLDIKRADGSSVLIPFAEDLLKECSEEQKLLVMEIPDGLLDEE
ncbi:MAG: ribosome maturation factor RimM [Bacteroidales bacterium]|nr:ribosome maturation factor RimM [Bacteroidales bacterium]